MTRPARLLFALVLAVGCDEGDAHFTTKFASDVAASRHSVSVLGVYKDGSMSLGEWESLASYLAPALGTACDVGYDALTASNATLADAIDEYTRQDGPNDDLLAQLAPAAKGDMVLVLTFAGKLPQTADAGSPHPASALAGARGGRGMRGGGRRRTAAATPPIQDTNELDISASLYSVSQGHSVALVALQYSGASLVDALTKFGTKLAQSLPAMHCAGWNWNVQIDPERIRQSIDN